MSKHEAVAVPSSQVQFPNRSAFRTAVQVGIPTFLSLALFLPMIINEILVGYGTSLPESVRGWLIGFAGLITVTASVFSRVMAIPGFDNWLRSTGLLNWLAPSLPVEAVPEVLVVNPENPVAAAPVEEGPAYGAEDPGKAI